MQDKKNSRDCFDNAMTEFLPHVAERFCPQCGETVARNQTAGQGNSALLPAGESGGLSIRSRNTGKRPR